MCRFATICCFLGLVSFVLSPSAVAAPASEPSTASAPPAAPDQDSASADATPPEDARPDAPLSPASESGSSETSGVRSPVAATDASGARPPESRDAHPDDEPQLAIDAIYEPPLPAPYTYSEPAPPPAPRHVAPRNALWLGARTGWFFPMGSLWQDGNLVGGICCTYTNRGFDDFATSGPLLELDLGARLGRHYNVFGLWEFGWLRDGDELGDAFGGQRSAHSHFFGLGLRFSSDPNGTGILVEIAIGHRRFEATWANGTEFLATDRFFNTRIGIGADLRLSEKFSLSPLLTIGGGIFEHARWTFADGSTAGAFSSFLGTPVDEPAQHVPVTLQVGIHHDAFGSR